MSEIFDSPTKYRLTQVIMSNYMLLFSIVLSEWKEMLWKHMESCYVSTRKLIQVLYKQWANWLWRRQYCINNFMIYIVYNELLIETEITLLEILQWKCNSKNLFTLFDICKYLVPLLHRFTFLYAYILNTYLVLHVLFFYTFIVSLNL